MVWYYTTVLPKFFFSHFGTPCSLQSSLAHKTSRLKAEVSVYSQAYMQHQDAIFFRKTKHIHIFMAGMSVNSEKDFVFLTGFYKRRNMLQPLQTRVIHHPQGLMAVLSAT